MEQPHTEVRGCWFRGFGEGRHDYRSIDESQAYVNTMSAPELWDYFCKTDGFVLKSGKALEGFMPDWIGEFYAYYQWYYNIPSSEVIKKCR